MSQANAGITRRAVLGAATMTGAAAAPRAGHGDPWYRRVYRWGQTNITEKDPPRYDIEWWRRQWKRTAVQAVIINAGGIVAYYPSKHPLHYRAEFLGERDLFAELTEAAHRDGLYVMARMDSSRAAEPFYRAHPDWFARDSQGNPYRAGDRYLACINSPYYEQYIPSLLEEIIERAHPDGFTDNSWAGLGRESICYCENCARRFRAATGLGLPAAVDWDDPAYRRWILWSYARRIEIWELNNRTTRRAGGRHCIWSGMVSGSMAGMAASLRDLREIARRAEILMVDHQRREDDLGFQQNAEWGKRVHELMGWEKLAPESMAMYQNHPGFFRVASKPAAEARLWMIAGIAGGLQPWWHYVGAWHEDRRMYRTPEPVMRWVRQNQPYLVNREPVAAAGLVWSQRNTDFFGRDEAAERVEAPYYGWVHVLVRARIPYLPVHADELARAVGRLRVLILPNLGALTRQQCDAIRGFVKAGGGLVATGATSLYDEWGDPLRDYALADLFCAHLHAPAPRLPGRRHPESPGTRQRPAAQHTYLRLHPALRSKVDGPRAPDAPEPAGERHEVLRGFEETDLIPFGGILLPHSADAGASVPLTYVPPFPTYPPEFAWMRVADSGIPALVLSEHGRARVAFLPAELDRWYFHYHLPDHANLLASLVRWCAREPMPLTIEGRGLLDCHLYRQQGRLILHIVNLSNPFAWRAPMEESLPVGPLKVSIRLPEAVKARRAVATVSGRTLRCSVHQGQANFEIPMVADHEMVIVE
ncbi:MAG: beta-galactosidase [Bryobacterales bacterium]|nr:beta-galactosidase [Bryobacteraceae bacterium]MDW8130208.1 beta-galactosidase [Bryobacterales bacterium]